MFVGKGTPFEDPRGHPRKDLTDGTSQTFLIVEAGEPVPWTRPDELPYAPDRPVPLLGGISRDGFRVAMGDGSVRNFKEGTPEATIRAFITRNGKEPDEVYAADP